MGCATAVSVVSAMRATRAVFDPGRSSTGDGGQRGMISLVRQVRRMSGNTSGSVAGEAGLAIGPSRSAMLEVVIVACTRCAAQNDVPAGTPGGTLQCHNCRSWLPAAPEATGDTSATVGLIGGAALGAAIAGPPGAIVGAILGALLGRHSKGMG